MELTGADAVAYLRGAGTIRDSDLIGFSISIPNSSVEVDLVFSGKSIRGESATVLLALRGVQAFNFSYACKDFPCCIEFFKCVAHDGNLVYVSLDPYKEDDEVTFDLDNDWFLAERITVSGQESYSNLR